MKITPVRRTATAAITVFAVLLASLLLGGSPAAAVPTSQAQASSSKSQIDGNTEYDEGLTDSCLSAGYTSKVPTFVTKAQDKDKHYGVAKLFTKPGKVEPGKPLTVCTGTVPTQRSLKDGPDYYTVSMEYKITGGKTVAKHTSDFDETLMPGTLTRDYGYFFTVQPGQSGTIKIEIHKPGENPKAELKLTAPAKK